MIQETRHPTIQWLTVTACAAFFLYASTPTLFSVCLRAIAADLGISYGVQGSIVLARAAVMGVATLGAGYLADHLGKRCLLTAAMLSVAGGMFWMGRSGGLAGLLGGIAVTSVGLGGLEALNGALICDLHPRAVASRVNFLYAFYPCGVVASALAAGTALDADVSWRLPFLTTVAPCVVIAAMYWVGGYPEAQPGTVAGRLTISRIIASGTFWLLVSAMLLAAGAMGCLVYWGPSFIQEAYGASAKAGSAGLALYMAAVAAGRFGMATATRFVPLLRLMLAMVVVGFISTLSVVLVDSLWATMAALLLSGVAFSCFWPGVLALGVSRIGPGSTTLLAMLSTAGIVGFGLLPYGVGQLAGAWGLRLALGVCPAAIAVMGVLLAVVSLRDSARASAGPKT